MLSSEPNPVEFGSERDSQVLSDRCKEIFLLLSLEAPLLGSRVRSEEGKEKERPLEHGRGKEEVGEESTKEEEEEEG